MSRVEPHFMAAFIASSIAGDIVEILPQSDLVSELGHLLEVQFDLFCHMLDGGHYGTNNLVKFHLYTEELKQQVAQLKEQK